MRAKFFELMVHVESTFLVREFMKQEHPRSAAKDTVECSELVMSNTVTQNLVKGEGQTKELVSLMKRRTDTQ